MEVKEVVTTSKLVEKVIARVKKMEQYLDEILAEVCNVRDRDGAGILVQNAAVQSKLETLRTYYESGLWIHDYECDERGELPADLKRGVLAQDTLYDLLEAYG